MKRLLIASVVLTCAATTSGCALYAPVREEQSVVRQVLSAQVIPPVRRPVAGTDGAAAVAAYANYQRSFVTPTPASDSATFGTGAK